MLDDVDENKKFQRNMKKIFKKLDLSLKMFCQWINLWDYTWHLTIIILCVFNEDGKFYSQLFLEDALYELV